MVGMEMEWRTHADTWAVQCDMHRIMRCKVHEKNDVSPLNNLMQSAHEWNVTLSTRKMCVCARPVRVLWTPPDAFRAVATVRTRNPEKKTASNQPLRLLSCWKSVKKIKTAVKLSGGWWQLLTCRLKPSWPVSWCLYRLHWERESMLPHFTIFQTTYRLAKCADATSANSESMKTNSNMLSLVTSSKKRMMAVDVLLRNIQPN